MRLSAHACIIYLLFSSLFSHADSKVSEHIVHFEDSPFRGQPTFCENTQKLYPTNSDFEVLNYALMSSKQGHRYAVITIKNTSSGQRIIKNEHLMAILANCQRIFPTGFTHKLKGGETITKEVDFGLRRFPIIALSVSKDLE